MNRLNINPVKKMSKEIYGHFAEYLGRGIYEGIYRGWQLSLEGRHWSEREPLQQVVLYCELSKADQCLLVEANGQTVHFRLKGDVDSEKHEIELSCREQCFAPEEPFLSYIKVKGITCAHGAQLYRQGRTVTGYHRGRKKL